jgi:beta-barrel assembly-enhancing protease
MKRQMLLGILGLSGFFALVLWGFSLWNPDIKPDLVEGISIQSEEHLGDLIFDFIKNDPGMDLNTDREVDSLLRILISPILGHHPLTDFDFRFYVLNNSMVNAFTIPGGRIFIAKGLIKLLDSQEEFIAVVAHEMGHVEKRHVIQKLAREIGIDLLLGMATGSEAILLGDISRSIVSTGFDRKSEKEADTYALDLMVESGVHPHFMATFFRRLNRENLSYNENIEFLMSHPHNNARIKAALEYHIPEDYKKIELEDDWSDFKSLIQGDDS